MTADDLLKTPEGRMLNRESPVYHNLYRALLVCRAEDRNAIVADVLALLVLQTLELQKAARARAPVVIHLAGNSATEKEVHV